MTGKERILARLRGEPTDSLSLMPITMMFAADLAGVHYLDYARDHRVLADAQAAVAERFGFDYVSAISDPAREAADLGGVVEWFDDQPPAIVESRALLDEKSKLASLRLPDSSAPGRMRDRVEAVRLLAERSGATRIVEGTGRHCRRSGSRYRHSRCCTAGGGRRHRHDGAGNMDDRFRVLRRRGETAEKKRTSGWLRGFHRWIFH